MREDSRIQLTLVTPTTKKQQLFYKVQIDWTFLFSRTLLFPWSSKTGDQGVGDGSLPLAWGPRLAESAGLCPGLAPDCMQGVAWVSTAQLLAAGPVCLGGEICSAVTSCPRGRCRHSGVWG